MLKRLAFWLLWPGLFVYFCFSRRARVLLIDGAKILLVKDRFQLWFNHDQWALPGGGLHRHETPAAGAVREIREELDIELDVQQLKLLWRGRMGNYGLRYRCYYLVAQVPQKTELRLKSSEIADAQWHKIDKLEGGLLKPEVQKALQLLAARQ